MTTTPPRKRAPAKKATTTAEIAAELNAEPASQALHDEIDRLKEQLTASTAAPDADTRDAELEQLRAELAAAKAPKDPRDAVIAALKAELEQIKAQPGGAEAELRKAFDALAAEVDRMKNGVGLVPVPTTTEPDPYLYHARLGNGDVIELQHPNVTHWHVDGLGPVPVESVWAKSPEFLAAAA